MKKNIKPVFLDVAKIVSKYDNLLGYWNFDEPNLGNWQESLKICGWFYKDIRNFDPYRTIFAALREKYTSGSDRNRILRYFRLRCLYLSGLGRIFRCCKLNGY